MLAGIDNIKQYGYFGEILDVAGNLKDWFSIADLPFSFYLLNLSRTIDIDNYKIRYDNLFNKPTK
jgi:hypothetical protein